MAAKRTSSTAAAAAAGLANRLVLGSGSNVVDIFARTRKLPMPGDKAYFADEKIVSGTVVGGVTLNHLSWARVLGAPTGLLAYQGVDSHGDTIRAKMRELGVDTRFVRAHADYSTSVSHILLDPSGERTIIMAPASTSRLTGDNMARDFGSAVRDAAMITTEISQLPLSGVQFLLDSAKRASVPSLLDVDVVPEVAVGPAQLGSLDELRRAVTSATVVKLTAGAAPDLLRLVGISAAPEKSLDSLAAQLADALGCKVCVVTDGARGSSLAVARDPTSGRKVGAGIFVPVYPGVKQVDATGE